MIKKILITVGIIIGVLVASVIIFLLTFDLNHYRRFAMDQASKMLGRPVEIRSLSTKLSLVPTIKVEGVRILDPDQKEPLLEIPTLEAVIDLPPLVHRQIMIPQIIVPQASLVWRQAPTPKEGGEEKPIPVQPTATKRTSQIWIENITINSLECSVGYKKPYEFEVNKLTLKGMSKFSFELMMGQNTISGSGNFGSILELLAKKENVPLDLILFQGKSMLKVNGEVGDLKNFQRMRFQIDGNIPSLSGFLSGWGIKNDKIPDENVVLKTAFSGDLENAKLVETTITVSESDLVLTTPTIALNDLRKTPSVKFDATLTLKKGEVAKLWGINPFEVTTKVTLTTKALTLSDIALNAGKSDIKGKLRLTTTGEHPEIQGNLSSVYFDVHDLFNLQKKSSGKETAGTSQTKILSADKLPFDLLKKINAELKLDVAHLKFSERASDYAGVTSSIDLKNGLFKSTTQAKIFDGSINNQLEIRANEKVATTTVQARSIRLDKVKWFEKSIRGSLANADISLSAMGESLQQLARSANGQILVEVTAGEIINKDFNSLPATLNVLKGKNNSLAFSTQDQKASLLCGAVNLPVRNGIATSNNQIALETDTLNFIINGLVNLSEEAVNLSMIPSVNQTRGMANEVLALGQSVQLVGPWNAIKISVDPLKATGTLMQMLGQKLSGEKTQNVQMNPTSLCQKVLGRPIIQNKTTKKTNQVAPKTNNTQNTPVQPQPNLKQKLVQSLSQALTDQLQAQKP